MYEVDFTGWTRTPEELDRLETDKLYRLKRNWIIFYGMVKHRRFPFDKDFFDYFWYYLSNLIFNKNNF